MRFILLALVIFNFTACVGVTTRVDSVWTDKPLTQHK